ncbi:MAG: glutamate-cysteine ligase family protein [Candidatus Eisenbacteria bacterium]
MGRRMEPLTVGYDWEMAILKKTGENISEREVELLADEIRRRLPWAQTGTDLELIESRVGCVRDFGELLRKSERFDEELRRALDRHGWSLLRGGARPFQMEPVGAHIHVGTFGSWEDAVRVQNGMVGYVAPLVALTAASPVYRGRSGEYKSYRVASFAEWCSMPQSFVEPAFAQPSWGEDVCNKLVMGPTVELRACDGAMSTRLMCEVVALVAGLMWHVAERNEVRPLTRDEYDAIMENRWRAAKHGLQATFVVDGDEVAADALLTTMVELAEDGMRVLGVSGRELKVLRAMVAKRQTQADFQLAVFEAERRDAHRLTRTMANIQRDAGAFEKYLRRAPALPAAAPGDHASEILTSVGRETPYSVLVRATPLSPARLDTILRRYVEEGALVEGRSDMGVRLYTHAELG